MTKFLTFLLLIVSVLTHAQESTEYKVSKGKLHKRGTVRVSILPDDQKFKVQMDYKVEKKSMVPVPSKLLNGKTVMEFPPAFKTEKGYKELEKSKTMEIPKAILNFKKKDTYQNLKNAYFIEVLPKNKKTKIDLIYHPSLPSVGWSLVQIEFISSIPVLDGYKLEAILKN